MSQIPIPEIIKRCINSDAKAQRVLYDMFKDKVLWVCRRYSKNDEDTKELFQECFYQIYISLNNFDDEKGELAGWIHRLCVYTIIKFKKKFIPFNEFEEIHHEVIVDNGFESSVQVEKIMEQIQSLPEGYRTVLNLYIFEEMSHQEIASLLQIDEGTSRSQLFKARALLNKKLTPVLAG